MAAKKKSASGRSAAKAKSKTKAQPKTKKAAVRKQQPARKKTARKKVAAQRKKPSPAKKRPVRKAASPKALPSPALVEIEQRIAIAQNNLRDLTEQAAGTSGSATEELLSDRISSYEAELKSLRQERDRLAKGGRR